ncbi:MAG: hypothetical protein AMDU4_FER2C00247G0018 [Ferroplasma sp. Type II]|jgi:hypothetical protein|nr:MAG: hypothetical protein AMDU4_FER2C00247G0018 [Ferroplasma sp. Type II]
MGELIIFYFYFISVYIALSVILLLQIIKFKAKTLPKKDKYILLSLVFLMILNVIVLLIIAYPYSSQMFKYDSYLSHQIGNIAIFSVIELIVVLTVVLTVAILQINSKNNKSLNK